MLEGQLPHNRELLGSLHVIYEECGGDYLTFIRIVADDYLIHKMIYYYLDESGKTPEVLISELRQLFEMFSQSC